MMDYFSPTFPIVLTEHIKLQKINFLRFVFTGNLTSPVSLSGLKTGLVQTMGVNIHVELLHLQNSRKTQFEHCF